MTSKTGDALQQSERTDFRWPAKSPFLSVAANRASLGRQKARLVSEQKRLTTELDRRVAQRTLELAAANEELRKEIAERRRAEEALKRSQTFLAEAQHLSSTGSFAWRVSTDEITWSDELHRIFRLDPPLTIEHIRTRVHPEDVNIFDNAIDEARRTGKDFECQHRLLMPDQSVKYLRVVARAQRGQDLHAEYIAAVQDVTEHRVLQEALDKARSQLSHVSRVMSLGTLTASIAHEVNQPLSGIVTNASTCLRMLNADPPNVEGARETARRTIRDGNRASDVITRLRALFGKRNAPTESVDLNEAIREIIVLSWSELERDRVLLRSELDDELPLVRGDRVQLQQVILNLLRNASEAMNGVHDRSRELLITTEKDEQGCARVTVRDAGIGFDPAAADKLFEAFYTTKNSGMGIGLSVSRSIIQSHGGRLWAESNHGHGATFSFSIAGLADIIDAEGRASRKCEAA